MDDARLLDLVAATDWDAVYHAYGPASDVPEQLTAVIAGDDAAREKAWWSLWGNIHHQGTIYEATVPAVPIVLGIAGARDHPDRAQAILMLREIAAAPGVYVWRHGEDGEPVTLEPEQERLFPVLRSTLEAGAAELLQGWRDEPEPVRRALLWLLSVVPELRARHADLIAETLPDRHRHAWDVAVRCLPESEEDSDAVTALEEWVERG